MYDAGKIITGLILFLVLFTTPIWVNLASGTSAERPDIKLPVDEKQCVAATEYMKASHMDLIYEWRDQVVREELRAYHSLSGKEYEMSLTKTCLGCHSNKAEFCDRCHNYVAVSPYCWDCHTEPKEGI
ncbi:MAG: sulfate reduction electron transfer complex DsrMKJOP subunit DsrJ [Candidatus Zixiibacteriota bacterium]